MSEATRIEIDAQESAWLDDGLGEQLRRLHCVTVDEIEFYFWEAESALEKLREEPDADYQIVTVH